MPSGSGGKTILARDGGEGVISRVASILIPVLVPILCICMSIGTCKNAQLLEIDTVLNNR